MAQKSHLSSLPLQVVLYFSGWYLLIFYVAELSLTIYKGSYIQRKIVLCVVAIVTVDVLPLGLVLPYPARNFAAEIILLFILAGLDVIRIFLG